jgi:hypothetical protein
MYLEEVGEKKHGDQEFQIIHAPLVIFQKSWQRLDSDIHLALGNLELIHERQTISMKMRTHFRKRSQFVISTHKATI